MGRYQPFPFRGFWQQLKFTISIFVLYLKGDRHDVTIKKGVCYVTYIEKKKSAA
jgi:hypothetical protein